MSLSRISSLANDSCTFDTFALRLYLQTYLTSPVYKRLFLLANFQNLPQTFLLSFLKLGKEFRQERGSSGPRPQSPSDVSLFHERGSGFFTSGLIAGLSCVGPFAKLLTLEKACCIAPERARGWEQTLINAKHGKIVLAKKKP